MFEKKGDKGKQPEYKLREDGVELESQFIMRVPKELADTVHEAISAGNIKDRLTIKLDQDLRYGEVRLDEQMLYAKLVDLPTVVESYKTIDNKSFYKSADICQLLICKEEPEDETEKESPNKNKKKDPNKVDKKYLWPHGITPPCKNVRKRRFRKTLKKKNVEAPEIEKEVKHLLRIDNEAVRVEYEIINEEDKPADDSDQANNKTFNDVEDMQDESTMHGNDKTILEKSLHRDENAETDDDETSNFNSHRAPNMGVAEHDIFGEEVSTTDDEDEPDRPTTTNQRRELEESSRLSADDSRLSDFFGTGEGNPGSGCKTEQNEFSKSMFGHHEPSSPKLSAAGSSSNLGAPSGFYGNPLLKREDLENIEFIEEPQYTQQQVREKIIQLTRQISDIKAQQLQKSTEIASIQNATLKSRMQETLDNLYTQVIEKELELKDFENMIES
ncbi:hypothetical protein KR018_010413 [Drosophila ironensis]|nr:hypothetical protein KR018_010413 [Drosophila ironensis]